MAGGSYAISEVTDVSLGYRYVRTEDISLKSKIGGAPQRMDFEYDAHEVYLGLRFNF
jgi:opacity protein-like surface antigen